MSMVCIVLIASHGFAANPLDFEVHSLDYNADGVVDLPGRLLVPTNYDPNQSYPLVVFYHGQDEGGTDNVTHVQKANIDNLVANAKSRDFFLYAPQGPANVSSWSIPNIDYSMIMAMNAAREYNIDREQIYVTGLSLGGGATWTAISRYADALAGAVPIAGIQGKQMDHARLIGKPIWAYHVENDPQVWTGFTRGHVNDIRLADGKSSLNFPLNADPNDPYYSDGSPYYSDGSTYFEEDNLHYSEYEGNFHGGWGTAYNEAHLYDWLLAQVATPDVTIGDTFLFDLGNIQVSVPDTNGDTWNSTYKNLFKVEGVALPFAKKTNGDSSHVSIEVDAIFPTHMTNGSSTGIPYDDKIGTDGWITEINATDITDFGKLTLSGLIPGAEYSLDIFATNPHGDGGRGRMSRYEVGTETRDIQVHQNVNAIASFSAVTADSNGEISIKVYPTPGSNSRYGQINTLEMSLVSLPSGPTPGHFEVYSFDYRNNGSIDLPGQLYVPSGYDENALWPMVIYLHGDNERGEDNVAQINSKLDGLIAKADSEGFFIYTPQLSDSFGSWNSTEIDKVVRVASDITRYYTVDFSKISLTGVEIGGGGVWNAFSRYAEAFAAAMPVCGDTSGATEYGDIVGLPIWAFHSEGDSVVPVWNPRSAINWIRAEDGKSLLSFPLDADPNDPYYSDGSPYYSDGSTYYEEDGLRYSEFNSNAHDIWTQVYSDENTYTWLLAQSTAEQDLLPTELMLFDFGNAQVVAADSQSRYWNSTDKHYYETYGPALPFAGTIVGRHTAVSVNVDGLFDSHMTNGVASGTPYDQDIATDGWLTVVNATQTIGFGELAVSGLVPGGVYRLEIFATNPSSDSNRGRMSRYEVGSATADLEVYNNTISTAVLNNCVADAFGEIRIKVYPTPGTNSRFGQINVLELSAVSLP